MHYTEVRKIKGMLLLIDFAKAFDSLSLAFIYKVLSYFGFDDELIKWIKMLYNWKKVSIWFPIKPNRY